MRRSEGVSLRIDDEMQAAIKEDAQRLGTDNVSQIVRTIYMLGHTQIKDIPTAISRRAFREGVLAGAAAVKAQIEKSIHDALIENPHNG